MKTMFLIHSLNYGGAERQLVMLARGLHEQGQRVIVVSFYTGGPLEKELHESGVTVRSLYKTGRWDIARFLMRLILTTQQEQPQTLYGFLVTPNILWHRIPLHSFRLAFRSNESCLAAHTSLDERRYKSPILV